MHNGVVGGGRRTSWLLVGVFVVLRVYATLGAAIAITPDTPSYFVFKWWGGVRFPLITAFYSLVGNHRAIVTIQALIGIACWAAAALLLESLLSRPWVRTGLEAAVLVLGLTLPVTRLDNGLISESLAVSLVCC